MLYIVYEYVFFLIISTYSNIYSYKYIISNSDNLIIKGLIMGDISKL